MPEENGNDAEMRGNDPRTVEGPERPSAPRSGERVDLSVAKGRVRGGGKCATHSNLEGFHRGELQER